jgi:hypothetical protein
MLVIPTEGRNLLVACTRAAACNSRFLTATPLGMTKSLGFAEEICCDGRHNIAVKI